MQTGIVRNGSCSLLQDREGWDRRRLVCVEIGADEGGGGRADYSGECIGGGLLDAPDRAEVLEEALPGAGTDARDRVELRVTVADLAAFAVVGDGEAMGFVPYFLDEVKDGGAAVEDDGVVLLAVDVDDLLALSDGGEGLGVDSEFGKGVGGGVELAEAAVDKDEGGEGLFVFVQALVTAVDDLTHGGEVVDAGDGFDLEFAVVGFLHAAVFPDDHGGDGFSALNVGDVEALDAFWGFGEGEGVLEGLGDGSLGGLENAEALVVGLLGVLAYQVDEGALFTTLGGG